MIRAIEFKNFKRLSGEEVNFGDLTLLTGANATGKSSVIQAILLTKLAHSTPSGSVPLNGEFGLALGEANDVVAHGKGETTVSFGFTFDAGRSDVSFTAEEGRRYLRLTTERQSLPQLGVPGTGGFTYLAAERDGPRESYDLPSAASDVLNVGQRGENTASIIIEYERANVDEKLEHPKAPKLRFAKQVEAWLGEFAPGTQLRIEANPEFGRAILRFKCGDVGAEWLRPGNFGFGVTYCLPIIVAGLLARPGSLLLIDSPEAHLHPAAQSAMGRFLSKVASTGAQVIIETHSDHVLNGVRLASLEEGQSLSREKILINHFSRTDGPVLSRIEITARGELSAHPKDFFDQTEKDLAEIVKRRLGSKLPVRG
ncbi:DUF3696 domain-containing protein [Microvirga sesbaniae]|uniref:DUF3696 domain-containing protein n=1 Tax=Microvirga sesbaniae TaxID=681392 RepID=UPI0021C830DB|nr:DUF3696 domain-containing protein [Microvirga sp. HBU67692]